MASDRKICLYIICLSLILRLILSLNLDFGVDESYMLAQSERFQLSYVDHPPLHVWLAGLMLKITGVSPWVRLPFILAFTLTSWILFLITEKLFSSKAALWSVIALNLSAFFIISPGILIVPDGLLILFLALAVYEFIKATQSANNISWLLLGVYLGLAGLSKYHGAIFGLSLAVYIIVFDRTHLKNPFLWGGVIIAFALQMPVIIWNMQNNWVSIAFQASRGSINGFKPQQFLQMLFGQLLILLPWVSIPIIIAVFKTKPHRLLLTLALPIIILFTLTPLWGGRGQTHWTMSGWFFLFPIFGGWLVTRASAKRWAILSTSALIVIPLILLQARFGIIPLKNDPTLEISNYNGLPPAPDYVVTTGWIEGGKIWIFYKGKVPVFVYGNDQRNFGINRSMKGLENKNGLLITSAKKSEGLTTILSKNFSSVIFLENRYLNRNSNDINTIFSIYSLQGIIKELSFSPFTK